MTIKDTLDQFGYALVDTNEDGEVWCFGHDHMNVYVSLSVGDGIIQAVKMPVDEETPTTVIHFNRNCDELTDLLRKWSDVTPTAHN